MKEKLPFSVLLPKQYSFIIAGIFLLISFSLALLLIKIQAYEVFYEYSRQHEAWDLDEMVLVILSIIFAGSISVSVLSFFMMAQLKIMAMKKIEAEKQVMHSRKIKSMGNMLGGVAHSMNNHLQPILTLSSLLKLDFQEGSEVFKDLDKIGQAARNASVMLKSVLGFAHQKESMEGDCEIYSTLRGAVELARITCPSAISVKEKIDSIEALVYMTQVDLEIIILNFFHNAIDAIGGVPGVIIISLEPCEKKDGVQKSRHDNWVCLSVSDSGSGITKEQMGRIFEPFYTTKPVGEGTGLGLAETYGIVSKAGGKIDVSSTPGEGTTFQVYLPVRLRKEYIDG